MDPWPIGVFASIDAGLGVQLPVARQLSVPTIQLHAPSAASRTPQAAESFQARLADMQIQLTAVFAGFAGESYADIPTVARTVGLVPAASRAERLRELQDISDFTRQLDCPVLGLHLGFVPHDTQSDDYRQVLEVTRRLCDYCAQNGQNVHLETGQETADALLQFLSDSGRDNLFVNFDPANMILYGTGEPIAALHKIGPWVRSVHCKDARWADAPGQEWGVEVPLGDGDVGIDSYLATLQDIGYQGPLTIEREIPQEPERQADEIRHAMGVLTRIKHQLGVTD